jgi:hypothetical protein
MLLVVEVVVFQAVVVFAKVGQPCLKSKDANGEQFFALRDCCMPLFVLRFNEI